MKLTSQNGRAGSAVQLIFICGKNEKLAAALRSQPSRVPRFVEGFATEIPYYMQLADFFIGKPGPGSIAEAMAMGLPVCVEHSNLDLAAGALQHRMGSPGKSRPRRPEFPAHRRRCGRLACGKKASRPFSPISAAGTISLSLRSRRSSRVFSNGLPGGGPPPPPPPPPPP